MCAVKKTIINRRKRKKILAKHYILWYYDIRSGMLFYLVLKEWLGLE